VLAPAEGGSRLLVVQKWRGDVDEMHVWQREQHLRALHIRKTEPRAQASDASRCVPAMYRNAAPGTCANCCAANMAKPPKPRIPMPTAFDDMKYPAPGFAYRQSR
jgi:hypothetical protein